jgi:hypothetical protein
MKSMLICFVIAAAVGCTFDPSGAPAGPYPDGAVLDEDGGIDGDAAIDAADAVDGPVVMTDASPDALTCPSGQVATPDGCQPIPSIRCSLETDGSGIRWRRLDFTGWVTYGLLGAAPSGETPSYIAYGSDYDSSAVQSSCNTISKRWMIPYPAGCTGKASVTWAGEPGTANVLKISENVENFNVAVVYTDGTVRWADIDLNDGDPDGFTVSGSGSGYNCHIVHPGGVGGIIQVAP